MIFVIGFTAIVSKPQVNIQRADAWFAPALPVAGTGAYVVGALAVGGFLTGLGIDAGDDINKHAGEVWDNLKADTKAALNSGYKTVKKYIAGVGEVDVLEFDPSVGIIDNPGVLSDISASARLVQSQKELEMQYFNPFEVPEGFVTNYPDLVKVYAKYYYVNYDFNNVGNDYVYMVFQNGIQRFYETMSFSSYWVTSRVQSTQWEFNSSLGYYGANTYDLSHVSLPNAPTAGKDLEWVRDNVHYIEQVLNDQRSVFGSGVAVTIVPRATALERAQPQARTNDIETTKKAIQNVGSAVLPISTVVDLNPDLTYHPDTNVWTDQGGAVANPVVPAPKVIGGKVTVPVNENVNIDVTDGAVVTTPIDTAPTIGEGAADVVSGSYFSQFWNWLIGILEAIRDGILNLAAIVTAVPVVSSILEGVDTVVNWTDSFFNSMATTLSDSLANLDTFAEEFWGSFTDSLALGLTGISDFTSTYWDSYTDSFAKGLEGLGP